LTNPNFFSILIGIRKEFTHELEKIEKDVSTGQEYQPGTPGIYLVVKYFERFLGVN
jgi:hypothetical protein